MSIYYLSKHVYAANINGYVVLLNSRTDQYLAIPPEISSHFSDLDTKRMVDMSTFNRPDPGLSATIENLLNEGILDTSSSSKHEVSPVYVEPQNDISKAMLFSRPSINSKDVFNFFRAFLKAVAYTKFLGFFNTINNVKLTRKTSRNCVIGGDIERVVGIFRLLRIFFYTPFDRCYFDCAVAVHFFRLYGFDPVWVFAANTEPFSAHCWVQIGDTVITDYLGATDRFHPIMIV